MNQRLKVALAESESLAPKKSRRPGKVSAQKAVKVTEGGLNISDIIDALPFYVMLVNEDHYILEANDAVRTALGVDPQSIIGNYCPSIIHGINKPIDECPLEEATQTNQIVEREILDKASMRWIRSCIYPTKTRTTDGKRIFFHTVTDITDRKNADEQLRLVQEQLRDLSFHLESVREEERKNLAREIHDELGQLLTGLKMDISWLSKKIPGSEASSSGKVKEMNELVDEALERVKMVSGRLRPAVLDHIGLAAAIEWQTRELARHVEINFEFKSNPKDITVDPDRSIAVFRIYQEALTNVIRHANATKATIALKKEATRILLKVSDNGRGFDKRQIPAHKTFGIIGMRERAMHWGGEVKINGAPGKGTQVLVSIPLEGHGVS